jgi:hypothetical protein
LWSTFHQIGEADLCGDADQLRLRDAQHHREQVMQRGDTGRKRALASSLS